MWQYKDIYGILALGGLQQAKESVEQLNLTDVSNQSHCIQGNQVIVKREYVCSYVEKDPYDYIFQMLWEFEFF